jgi:hypothetical protein
MQKNKIGTSGKHKDIQSSILREHKHMDNVKEKDEHKDMQKDKLGTSVKHKDIQS